MRWRYLFSRSVTRQVFSAEVSLTSVFGMGTGGPSPQSTPTIDLSGCTLKTERCDLLYLRMHFLIEPAVPIVGQALGLLVPVSYTRYRASTPGLSTT